MNRPVSLLMIVLAHLAVGGVLASAASAEWITVRDENGVVVQEQAVAGQDLPIFKGVTTIEAPAEAVLLWLRDASTYTEWMHNCSEAKELKNDGDVRFVYNRIKSPWPVSDRDVVLRSELVAPPRDGAARIEFTASKEIQFDGGSAVRMPRLVGYYDLQPTESGGTRIEYQVDSDAGGSLPKWMVAQVGKELPYFTLINLRAKVTGDR